MDNAIKIAGKNGNPLDFEGDKFPVEDKQLQSVINELNKVKSELESIKNGTLKVKNDQLIDKIDALLAKQQSLEDKINSVMQGNAFRTQLTGSNVEEVSIRKREQLLPRAVRTSSASLTITVPIGAKKAVILGRFNGFTGTNVEYYLSAYLRGTVFPGNAYGPRLTTEKQSSSYAEHFIYIGSNGMGDATPSLGKVVTTPLPLTHAIKFDLIINGEFEEGQGVDCSAEIFWIS